MAISFNLFVIVMVAQVQLPECFIHPKSELKDKAPHPVQNCIHNIIDSPNLNPRLLDYKTQITSPNLEADQLCLFDPTQIDEAPTP